MNTFQEIPVSSIHRSRRKLIFGVGINDVNYLTTPVINGKTETCPYYSKWHCMLKRCYSKKCHTTQPTYIGCTVCKDWLTFSIFKDWMMKQDWKGKHLDKDLLVTGNKIYSPDTCIFVTPQINSLLNNCASKRGKYPIGVHYCNKRNLYVAQCSNKGKPVFLGYFTVVNEAAEAYRSFKKELILQVAYKEKQNMVLSNALYRIANEM